MIIISQVGDATEMGGRMIPQNGDSPERLARQLAGITAMAAKVLCAEMNLPANHEEQIEAEIMRHYVRLMEEEGIGDVSFRRMDKPASEEPT